MKYKEMRKLLEKTQFQLAIANKTIHDLIELTNEYERVEIAGDKELEKCGFIIDYLEDRQIDLIRSMVE